MPSTGTRRQSPVPERPGLRASLSLMHDEHRMVGVYLRSTTDPGMRRDDAGRFQVLSGLA